MERSVQPSICHSASAPGLKHLQDFAEHELPDTGKVWKTSDTNISLNHHCTPLSYHPFVMNLQSTKAKSRQRSNFRISVLFFLHSLFQRILSSHLGFKSSEKWPTLSFLTEDTVAHCKQYILMLCQNVSISLYSIIYPSIHSLKKSPKILTYENEITGRNLSFRDCKHSVWLKSVQSWCAQAKLFLQDIPQHFWGNITIGLAYIFL